MLKKRLLWQLYWPFLLITVLSLLVVTLYAEQYLYGFYLERTTEAMESQARMIERQIAETFSQGNEAAVDGLCKQLGQAGSIRVTVILPSGKVIGDTDENPAQMENHVDRPEVIQALQGQVGTNTRHSKTLNINMRYVAVPVMRDDAVIAVLRLAQSIESIDRATAILRHHIFTGGAVVLCAAAILIGMVSRRISGPLEDIKHGAERFATGDLNHKIPIPDWQEMTPVAKAINQMARQLDERIQATVAERNKLDAIVSSMSEGVLAVDDQINLLILNDAARRLLGCSAPIRPGRPMWEVVWNNALLAFVERILAGEDSLEGQMVQWEGQQDRHFQARGAALRDSAGRRIGAVIVLNDVTQLRRLENVRKDFVANVSHELKTPITSIKGFIETLSDGAIHDPADAKRFLDIVARQTQRLNAIIDDLLTLSRIEQQADRAEMELHSGALRPVIQAAVQLCEGKAAEKEVSLQVGCPEDLTARMNAALLEQAVVNLIDNAIKYSNPKSEITITAARTNGMVAIRVVDSGCGIEPEYLPRLFERFYRVDKARSRKQGGTGLGLAIVKHIAQAHGGQVTVESTPGRGSTFSIHLTAGS
jgi:two-component system, OmpR family, phosphate regulon sensor histidine kinase PhoR